MVKKNKNIFISEFPSTFDSHGLGGIFFIATEEGLSNLVIGKSESEFMDSISSFYKEFNVVQSVEPFKVVINNLKKYFSGGDFDFSFPIDLKGTEFQKSVWKGIKNIPFGATKSYKELSISIGRDNAIRAVGTACGKNPIPIIIPCHRVIASDGSIGGFSLGLKKKRILTRLEGISL